MAKGRSRRSAGRQADPGVLRVSCHVSDRWLRFHARDQVDALEEDLFMVDVMTLDDEGEPYKLCDVVVARGDLLRAIAEADGPVARVTKPVRARSPKAAATGAPPVTG